MKQTQVLPKKYFVRLDRGDKVNSTLKEFCVSKDIKCAKISGIGALEEVELGYYNYDKDLYDKKTFANEYELLSMEGNVSLLEKDTFVHLHITMSDEEYKVFGGHLFEATVAVTLECWIEVFDEVFVREKSDKQSFAPIKL